MKCLTNKNMSTSVPNTNFFNPKDIIKKEARGLGDDTNFGEVQHVTREFVVTQKGTADKDVFYIPKDILVRFDGSTVYFNVTKDEVKKYKRD